MDLPLGLGPILEAPQCAAPEFPNGSKSFAEQVYAASCIQPAFLQLDPNPWKFG